MTAHAFHDTAIVIPARLASTRFPEKALAMLAGKPVILHVWERCQHVGVARVVIATDHERIGDVIVKAGGQVVFTDPGLPSGTDRCAVVARSLHEKYIINVQGDEPFIEPQIIRQLAGMLREDDAPIATLARRIKDSDSLLSPNIVKVITAKTGEALYFSRQAIPYVRDQPTSKDWPRSYPFLAHIGIYGFRRESLLQVADLEPTELERTEHLEQLRWLDHGYRIKVGVCEYQAFGIDTPEDLYQAERWLAAQSNSPENP